MARHRVHSKSTSNMLLKVLVSMANAEPPYEGLVGSSGIDLIRVISLLMEMQKRIPYRLYDYKIVGNKVVVEKKFWKHVMMLEMKGYLKLEGEHHASLTLAGAWKSHLIRIRDRKTREWVEGLSSATNGNHGGSARSFKNQRTGDNPWN